MSYLNAFLSFLVVYKYVGLFVISFVAALAIPIPTSTTLAAAGAFSVQGYFSLPLVLLTALAGNVAGDTVGYFAARRYGERTLIFIGLRRVISSPRYANLKEYVRDYPGSLIFFTRFLTEVGPTVNVLSGLAGVPYRTFFIFDLLGETSYVLLYGLAGYFLGGQWENNVWFLAKGGLVMFLLGVTVNLMNVLLYRKRGREARGSRETV